MLESGQFPLHCPGCRLDATSTAAAAQVAAVGGEISEECLSFLQLRGIISRPLLFRLMQAARNSTATRAMIESTEYSACPADCGLFLLNSHPTYNGGGALGDSARAAVDDTVVLRPVGRVLM